jgi:hypothetical protein
MVKQKLFAVLTSKGKRLSSGVAGRVAPMVWTASEVRKLARRPRKCFTVVNLRTQRTKKVGGGCRKKRRRR